MDDLAGGASYSVYADNNATHVTGQTFYWQQNSGGNPKLRPWRANAVDLALEKYFSNVGYVSVAIYYKRLTSYMYPRYVLGGFTGSPLTAGGAGGANYT